MAFTAKTGNSAWAHRPDVAAFHAEDVVPEALILQASTVSGSIEGDEPSLRVAYVDDDDALYVAEGAEVPEATPALSEAVVFSGRISQLIRVTKEQYRQELTSDLLSTSAQRALIKKADEAFLAQPAPTPPAHGPSTGLLNIPGLVDGGEVYNDLDVLVDLEAQLQSNGATPSHVIVDPLGWAALRKLKAAIDSNMSLVGAGVVDAAPLILSLPVLVNRNCPPYSGLMIDKTAVVSAVGEVYVDVSTERYFEHYSIGLMATWRIGATVVRPERCGKFTVFDTEGGS
ncbi:hypothetical protein BH10ACT9_BH10ACT9_58180 [soil metagenome]